MNDFNLMINNNNYEGIIIVIDKYFVIEKVNQSFLDLLDYEEKDVIKKPLIDFIIPDEKSLFLDMAYKKNVSNFISLKFYHKSGAFRFFSITFFEMGDQKVIIGKPLKKEYSTSKYYHLNELQIDINKLFENIDSENIRDFISFSDNKVSLLLNLLPIEVWVKDKFGNYIFANEKYSIATGIPREKMYMKDDFQLFENEVAKEFLSTDHQAIESGKKISFSFQTDIEQLRGFAEVTKIPIYNKDGKYIGIIGFSMDITHSKKIETRLDRKVNSLMYILDNIEGLIFEIDNHGTVTFISGKLKHKLQFVGENVNLIELFSSNDVSTEFVEKIRLALTGSSVEMMSKIGELDIVFRLNPIKKTDGTYKIIGFGNEIAREDR